MERFFGVNSLNIILELKLQSDLSIAVLDPFCGCGTTIHAAQKLGRQWIGIDARTPPASNTTGSSNPPAAAGEVNNPKEREHQLIEVRLRRNEPVEKALRRLKRQMLREGVFQQLRQRRYYLKPSVSLRMKMKAARFEAMLKQRHADD